MRSELAQSVAGIAAKSSPPVFVLATAAAGWSWQTIVWIVTAAYVTLQFGLLAWDRLIKPLIAKLRKD